MKYLNDIRMLFGVFLILECPNFCYAESDFDKYVIAERVSLVVVAESNASLASLMGHSFIKLSGRGREHAVGFSTVITGDLMDYINALFGTSKGIYTLRPYFVDKNHYTKEERRPLWEFELRLAEEQKNLLKNNIRRLEGKEATYSFVNNNCNSVVERLLSDVDESYKADAVKGFMTPVEYAGYLVANDKVENVVYIPVESDNDDDKIYPVWEAKKSSRIALEGSKHGAYVELFPVYQDMRAISEAYKYEMDSKLLSFRFKFGNHVKVDSLSLLKLTTLQPLSSHFDFGYEKGFKLELGVGGAKKVKGHTVFAIPVVGVSQGQWLLGADAGVIINILGVAKSITKYRVCNIYNKFMQYFGVKITKDIESYVQYDSDKHDSKLKVGLSFYF